LSKIGLNFDFATHACGTETDDERYGVFHYRPADASLGTRKVA